MMAELDASLSGGGMEGLKLTRTLNAEFRIFFKHAFAIIRKKPGYRVPVLRHLIAQRRASRRRYRNELAGDHIPPFLIFSITQKCNLNCAGCYAKNLHAKAEAELEPSRIESLLDEAQKLGISIVLLAGGEPLMRPDILGITAHFPKMIFPVFTNGLLVDEAMAMSFKKQKNIIPVISLEGSLIHTDARRGQGVFESVLQSYRLLKAAGALFGASITVTRENFDNVTSGTFMEELAGLGASLVFFIEYIPCSDNSKSSVITNEQRLMLKQKLEDYRRQYAMILVSFPGDEEVFGGCLAAGRGFVHISSSGRLEPCPFSPFSDISLKDHSLKEALKSKFLVKIRENHDGLSEHEGGCALWENREWVSRLLDGQDQE